MNVVIFTKSCFKSIGFSLAAMLVLSAISSRAQDVNVTGTLTYAQGTGGVYDYTLTLSNAGPESVNSLWLGWTVGVFDIQSPSNASSALGWTAVLDGNSIQFGPGTDLAAGGSTTFSFASTSTPADFQAATAGPSVVYGTSATPFAIENTTLHSEEFTPTVVSTNPPQNVNVTGTLTYAQGTNGVYDYTLTLSNVGPEAVNSLWLGWTVGVFDIQNPTNASSSLNWTAVLDGASVQFGPGTPLAASNSATFSFASTSTPADFQAATAGPSVVYGVNSTPFAIVNTTPDTEEFTPTVVSTNSAQNVNVSGTLTYVPGAGGVYDYTLTLSNAGPEAVESLWLGWTVGVFDIASPSGAGTTLGWNGTVEGNSIQFAGTTGTALAAGNSATFTFKSTSTPAQFQAGTAGPSVAYGVNASQFAIENTTADSEQFTPTVISSTTSGTKEVLAVTVNPAGSGRVTPNDNGKTLLIGHTYTVTAVPAKGRIFTNWTGLVQSDTPTLTFILPNATNATLTANFIPSPFTNNGVMGIYSGLFLDPTNLSYDTSGFFSGTVGGNGVLDGQVKIGGLSIAFATTLHADGSATLDLKRHGLSPLVVTLQVDLTGLQTITGTVGDTNGTFHADLTAYRAGFGASQTAPNFEGYYTWTMAGGTGNAPAGFSYGTATVAANGRVRFGIFLSDGTTTSASGSLATNGLMPLYVPLYGGKGSFFSWLSFSNSLTVFSTNNAYWFKAAAPNDPPADPSAPSNPYPYSKKVAKEAYSSGFGLTNLALWMGAYAADPAGSNALNDSNVTVQLSAADLTSPVSNTVALNAHGVGGSTDTATLSVSGKTGLFSGSFNDPASGKIVHFKGVVLSIFPAGYGFFISDALSGAALIEPQ